MSIMRLLAKIPTMAAWAFKNEIGHPVNYPDNSIRLLFELFEDDVFCAFRGSMKVDPVIANALDKLLILHADHEQNCSTSTVRIVGSSHASLYASIAAGISALWGPLHGGCKPSGY